MAHSSEHIDSTSSPQMAGNTESLGISHPPAILKIPIHSTQSEATLVTPQPRIDALPNQTYVTRKDRLGLESAWIDCDFCRRRTKTKVDRIKIPNDNQGILACLLCLVCPCLICLAFAGDNGEEVNHYCTGDGCGRRVTHKRPDGPIQVLKPEAPIQEVTKYGVAAVPEVPGTMTQSMKYE